MTLDWSPLTTEMSRWRAEGRTIPIWWRDDDAVAVTPELEQLQNLSVITGVPVHLAVIPAGAKSDLATFTAERPNLLPLVHGWSHTNNAPRSEKKAEFSVSLDPEDMARDCKTGLTTMRSLFGDAMWPVFVPAGRSRVYGHIHLQTPQCDACCPRIAADQHPSRPDQLAAGQGARC